MKYILYISLCYLSISFQNNNQLLTQVILEWDKLYYFNNVWVYGMGKDNTGNVYVSGCQNNAQAFILKYSSSGQLLWSRDTPEINSVYSNSSNLIYNNNFIYIAGRKSPNLVIQKYSLNGDQIWSRSIDFGYSFSGFGVTTDKLSNIIAVSAVEGLNSGFLIVKLDSSGNYKWQRKCHIPIVGYVTNCTTDQLNNIYFTGSSYGAYDDIITVKYNPEGDSLWCATEASNNYDYSNSIITDNAGKIIVTGQTERYITGTNGKITTVKYDTNGNLLWRRKYSIITYPDDYGKVVKTDPENNIYVGGFSKSTFGDFDIVIIKYNQNGDSLWVRRYDSGNRQDEEIYDMKLDSLNNIYITGYNTVSNGIKRIMTLKYSSNGELLWSINYDYNYSFTGLFLELDNVNNIFVSGSNLTNLSSYFAVCLKYSQITGINNQNNYLPVKYSLYQNYPNPFNPTTNIQYEIPKPADVTIKIYDLLGKEVFSLNEYKQAGSYEVKFDGSNLASGMYFYSIEANGFKDVKKMVLLK